MLIAFDYDKHYQTLIDRFNAGMINPNRMDQLINVLDEWKENSIKN